MLNSSCRSVQEGRQFFQLVLCHCRNFEIGGGKAAGAVAAAMGEEEAEGVEEAAQEGFDGGAAVKPGAIAAGEAELAASDNGADIERGGAGGFGRDRRGPPPAAGGGH